MKPYYADDAVTIYHADCRDILPTLGTVDLIVTDPPYGVEWQGQKRTASAMFDVLTGDDGSLDTEAAIALALKQLRRGRHIYVFGPLNVESLPLGGVAQLIWDKGIVGLGDLSLPWGPSHETITFGVYEYSKANRQDGAGALAARLRRGSVIRCQRKQSGQVCLHPTEKPVLLLRQMIESSSVFDETVLDPFAGSGSTLVAARLEGRKAIGIEIEERYCEIAAKRMAQGVLL